MSPFTVNLNAGRAAVQHTAQPVPSAALDNFQGQAASAYGGSFQGEAAAAYGGWMPAQAVGAPLPSYGFEGGGGMQYGVGHSSSASVYNDDPGLAGVGYAVPFQAAAVSGGAAGVVGVGSGLQGQKMKNQQISFQQQQQQQQQKQQAVEAPPPLIKFNAPKLSTGTISICTHPVPHTLTLSRPALQTRAPTAKPLTRRFGACIVRHVIARHTPQPSFEVGGVAIPRRTGAAGGPVVRPLTCRLL
jgi:hypothetical protein